MVSRQRKWQLKKRDKGLCEICGKRPQKGKARTVEDTASSERLTVYRWHRLCNVCSDKRKAQKAKTRDALRLIQADSRDAATAAGLSCCRCGHNWQPRQTEIRVCPKCKSPYWDRVKGGRNGETST